MTFNKGGEETVAVTDQPKTDLGLRTVYCGNLSWSVNWKDLKDHLATIGPVEHADVLQYRDGRKTGSGVVRFEKAEDAARAIDELKDSELKGRPLLIRADRENGTGPGSVRKGGKGTLPDEIADKQIYISNLSWKTTWKGLKSFCEEKIGPVAYCDVLANSDGRSAGSGVVRFVEQSDAEKAKREFASNEDSEHEIDGRPIYIREDRQRRPISGLSDMKGFGKGKGKGKKGSKGKGKKGDSKGSKGKGSTGEWSLFIGNLEKGTDWKALKEAFEEYWPTHVSTTETKGDKCFAIVKFAKASHAEEAIEGMHKAWIGENQVTVRWDRQ